MKTKFNVTYDIMTEESLNEGDYAECGFISQDVSLRQAIEDLGNGAGDYDMAEAHQHMISAFFRPDYRETEDYETRTLHIPENVSVSSCHRIARYLGAHIV
mgnify:CR=1 FL=1